MTRGRFAGATDYSHQSFRDILDDLSDWKSSLNTSIDEINLIIRELQVNFYWTKVPHNFKSLVAFALKYYQTSIFEISDIIQNLEIEVQQNHISRLRSLANTADDLNMDFGSIWHREYGPKDYTDSNFVKVEKIYGIGRDMVVDMLDLSNVAARLEDYLGMKSGKVEKRVSKNPWVPILLLIIGIITAVTSNIASNTLPAIVQPYLWLSWPFLGILTIISIILLRKQ